MEVELSIDTLIIKANNYFLFVFCFIAVGSLLTLALMKISLIFLPIGIIFFWLGPGFLFQNSLRQPFLRVANIGFSNEGISFQIENSKTSNIEKIDVLFNQIESFKMYNSSKDDSSFLKLSCKGGRVLAYTFVGQTNEGSNLDITQNVIRYIRIYNQALENKSKITLQPSLFASKRGGIYILILASLLAGIFIWQLLFKPKTIPATILASLFLTLQIIGQRKKDIKDLEQFNKN